MRAYALIGMLNRYGGSGSRPWRWAIQQRQSWPGDAERILEPDGPARAPSGRTCAPALS